ncbi:MAG: hypothetical protein AB7O62_24800 [Pirellulales bacterium]
MPRDHWLTEDEKQRVRACARANPLEGYRRLASDQLEGPAVLPSNQNSPLAAAVGQPGWIIHPLGHLLRCRPGHPGI